MAKTPKRFPVTVTEAGVTAKIRKFSQIKNGREYTSFIVNYILLGKHKREWKSDFEEARQAAIKACRVISNGQHQSLTLTDTDNDPRARTIVGCKAIALAWVVQPEIFKNVSLTELAGQLGYTTGGVLSRHAADFTRRFGLCNRWQSHAPHKN